MASASFLSFLPSLNTLAVYTTLALIYDYTCNATRQHGSLIWSGQFERRCSCLSRKLQINSVPKLLTWSGKTGTKRWPSMHEAQCRFGARQKVLDSPCLPTTNRTCSELFCSRASFCRINCMYGYARRCPGSSRYPVFAFASTSISRISPNSKFHKNQGWSSKTS